MSEHIEHANRPHKGYEESDVGVQQLFGFAAGVVGLIVFGVLVSIVVFRFFKQHQSLGPPASPFADVRELPPGLRLQTDAPKDLENYHADQDKTLKGYAWVDSQNGVVRIPIERAMELMLAKGYPVRASTPTAGADTKASSAPAITEAKH